MEEAVTVLRSIHIAAGTLALFVFGVPLVVKKGGLVHRRVGWVYVAAMVVAAATAWALAPIRMIQRPRQAWGGPLFLAYVGLISFTASYYGIRVLGQKRRTGPHSGIIDYVIPAVLLAATAAMAAYGALTGFALGLYFTPIGLLVAVPTLRTLARPPERKTFWLTEHLGAMLISTIATITAFAVVNAPRDMERAALLLVWLGPTVVFTPLLVYWKRRYADPTQKDVDRSQVGG